MTTAAANTHPEVLPPTLTKGDARSLEQTRLPVASAVLRTLSGIYNTIGERTMLTVYDRALKLCARIGRTPRQPHP